MASPLQPEFFLLLGVDFFLALSLLSCLLDRHFPWHLPYLYQLAALAGFGQLLVSKEFMMYFGDFARFWFSFFYLVVALASIIAVNLYLGVIKKLLNYSKVIMCTVTLPSIIIAAMFLLTYGEISTHPFFILPQMSWEASFVGIVAFDTFVVGVGTYIFFKPKWWYITTGAGAAIVGAGVYAFFKPSWGLAAFVVSAIALAIACILVLGVSIYILVRIWKETLKEKRRRRR